MDQIFTEVGCRHRCSSTYRFVPVAISDIVVPVFVVKTVLKEEALDPRVFVGTALRHDATDIDIVTQVNLNSSTKRNAHLPKFNRYEHTVHV